LEGGRLMILPINLECIDQFVIENKLFEKTREYMKIFIENWFEEDKEGFIDDFGTDLSTVLATYNFENGGVSFSKDYFRELDYISVRIEIKDDENDYFCTYTAFYDYNLNCFDDKVGP
jgi:hypothetical protein